MSQVRRIVGRHSLETTGEAELYETPAVAVAALMAADPFFHQPRKLWDPCCGPGSMVSVLQRGGHEVVASDLYQYEGRWSADPGTAREWRADFLEDASHGLKRGVEAIVMNPPYSKADRFLAQAMGLVPRVYALLEIGWQQGESDVRKQLLDGGPWCRYHPFTERLNMNRDGWEGPDANDTRKHAWFVFGKAHIRAERPMFGPVVSRLSIKGGA